MRSRSCKALRIPCYLQGKPMSHDLRFPVGRFTPPISPSASDQDQWIATIAELPAKLRVVVAALADDQLDTPYRPGGWTVRQVVHHLPDSHLNAYTRFKLALTEQEPTIRPYDEARWAQLPDSRMSVQVPLNLLEALHERWVFLLRELTDADFDRGYRHPEQGRVVTLREAVAMYAWHSRHHLAHVTGLRDRMGWRR